MHMRRCSDLRAPAPSLLALAGLLVGSLSWVPAVRVPPEVVSLIVLPPLLYTAGEELSRLHDIGEIGEIGESTRRIVQRMLDLQETALNEEQ